MDTENSLNDFVDNFVGNSLTTNSDTLLSTGTNEGAAAAAAAAAAASGRNAAAVAAAAAAAAGRSHIILLAWNTVPEVKSCPSEDVWCPKNPLGTD